MLYHLFIYSVKNVGWLCGVSAPRGCRWNCSFWDFCVGSCGDVWESLHCSGTVWRCGPDVCDDFMVKGCVGVARRLTAASSDSRNSLAENTSYIEDTKKNWCVRKMRLRNNGGGGWAAASCADKESDSVAGLMSNWYIMNDQKDFHLHTDWFRPRRRKPPQEQRCAICVLVFFSSLYELDVQGFSRLLATRKH